MKAEQLVGQIEPADVTIPDKVAHCYQDPERSCWCAEDAEAHQSRTKAKTR